MIYVMCVNILRSTEIDFQEKGFTSKQTVVMVKL